MRKIVLVTDVQRNPQPGGVLNRPLPQTIDVIHNQLLLIRESVLCNEDNDVVHRCRIPSNHQCTVKQHTAGLHSGLRAASRRSPGPKGTRANGVATGPLGT